MRQSIFIIYQCLDNMPIGAYKIFDPKLIATSKSQMHLNMEATISHFKYYSQGIIIPVTDIYLSTETPKGEFGVYLVANNTNKPYRIKFKSPGFTHLQFLSFLAVGCAIADLVTIIGTLDLVFGEIDR